MSYPIINPQFTYTNMERSAQIISAENFNIDYFALALAEEAGEVAGAIKKMKRGFNEREGLKIQEEYDAFVETCPEELERMTIEEFWLQKKKSSLGKELADIIIYADLAASSLGVSINRMITEKFNQVSKELGIAITL